MGKLVGDVDLRNISTWPMFGRLEELHMTWDFGGEKVEGLDTTPSYDYFVDASTFINPDVRKRCAKDGSAAACQKLESEKRIRHTPVSFLSSIYSATPLELLRRYVNVTDLKGQKSVWTVWIL